MTDDQPDRGDALRKILGQLKDGLQQLNKQAEEKQRRSDELQALTESAEAHGGIVVPMQLDLSGLDPEYVKIAQELTDEQSKASLFLSGLADGHPYRLVFDVVTNAWSSAAALGAVKLAEHLLTHHGRAFSVGPHEFNSAWSHITTTAVMGAIRYGQTHPDAFMGLEGIEEGEIDQTITTLLDWADKEFDKAKAEEDQKDPTEEA